MKRTRTYYTTQEAAESFLKAAGYVSSGGQYYAWVRDTETLPVFASVRTNGQGYFIALCY